jgi:hypothetical protein
MKNKLSFIHSSFIVHHSSFASLSPSSCVSFPLSPADNFSPQAVAAQIVRRFSQVKNFQLKLQTDNSGGSS